MHLLAVGADPMFLVTGLFPQIVASASQKALRLSLLAVASRLRPRRHILLEAFEGWAPCDAPLGIAAEIRSLLPAHKLYWAGARAFQDAPLVEDLQYVQHGSWQHARLAARAAGVVTTHSYPRPLNRRAIVVQAWHGTPLKRLSAANLNLSRRTVRRDRRRSARWDLFPSPSAFYDRTTAAALGVPASSVLRSPHPRYANAEHYRSRRSVVRSELGAAEGERLILFAPTYRASHDGGHFDPADMLAELAETLKPAGRVVWRGHYYASVAARDYPPGVIDGNAVVDPLLLLASCDVLITDYSSMLVDAMALGIPSVICAPDYDAYVRAPGLNVDLPGRLGRYFTRSAIACAREVGQIAESGEQGESALHRLMSYELLGESPWDSPDGAEVIAEALADCILGGGRRRAWSLSRLRPGRRNER